jgi:hypothetical protein
MEQLGASYYTPSMHGVHHRAPRMGLSLQILRLFAVEQRPLKLPDLVLQLDNLHLGDTLHYHE